MRPSLMVTLVGAAGALVLTVSGETQQASLVLTPKGLLGLLDTGTEQQTDTTVPERFIFVWETRAGDLEAESTAARQLAYILRHAQGVTLTTQPGDTLDSIIRTRYNASSGPHPRAYTLYRAEILRRNPVGPTSTLLENLTLRVASPLEIPSGPRYSLTVLPTESVAAWGDRVERSGVKRPWDYGPFAGMVGIANRRENPHERREIYEDERLVPPPEAADDGIGFGAMETVVSAGPLEPTDVRVQLSPATIPAFQTIDEGCGPCVKSRSLVNSSEDAVPLPSGPVLIADSGLRAEMLPGASVVAVKDDRPDASLEVSPVGHGSFIYSQLVSVAGTLGMLDPTKVEVANVATVKEGQLFLDFDRLFAVLKVWEILKLNSSETYTSVVNLSFAGGEYPQSYEHLSGEHKGRSRLLFVVASGNSQARKLSSTLFASQNNVTNANLLVVGALGQDNKTKAFYSNVDSSSVDLLAQGSCLCGYGLQLNGTSHAAPVVAAAAAMLAKRNPKWTPQDIKWRLISTSDIDDSSKPYAIGGRLNYHRASEATPVIIKRSGEELVAASVRFDDAWRKQLAPRWELNERPVLRVSRTKCLDGLPDALSCFAILRRATDPTWFPELVLANDARIDIDTAGGEPFLTAEQLDSIVFPLHHAFAMLEN